MHTTPTTTEPSAEDIDRSIAALEAQIKAARRSLPYLERGYFDAEQRIRNDEQRLRQLKQQRQACTGNQ